MGYYSDIAIGMKKNDGVRFLREFAMSVPDSGLLDKGFTMRQYPEYVVFAWNDVKCHSDYRDVQWIEGFLKELCDAEYPVAFARVGEAYDDCEQWSCNDDDFDLMQNLFWLNRKIELAPISEKGIKM